MDAKTGSIDGCPGPTATAGVRALLGRTNKDWWPRLLATEILNPNGPTNPHGDGLRLRRGVQALDYTRSRPTSPR
jgi:catalase-peroxidase